MSGQSGAVCVTGATGFIGAHVAAAFTAANRRRRVRVTYRDRARLRALEDVDVDAVEADVFDRRAMLRALEGCELLVHTAGMVASSPERRVWETNAVAPRLAVEYAAEAGVRRVVLTSSVASIGPAPPGRAANERNPYPPGGTGLLYTDSKHAGESAAFVAGRELGVEVVAVCPSYVLGEPLNRALPGETSTRIVGNYLRGRLPAIVDSYTNIVDVHDVAQGHLLASRAGKPGERYIIGGHNLRWSEVMEQVARLAGRRHPLIVLPPEAASAAGMLKRLKIPVLPLEGIRLMAPDWRYSSSKAKRELGYRPRPLAHTLKRTVDWYLELIEAGRFDGSRRNSYDLMATWVRLAGRAGLLFPLRQAGRLAGRRVVI